MTVKVEEVALDNLVVSIPPEVLFQEVGEETVILSIESGEYYGVNEVGSRIWALLVESQPMKNVIGTLIKEYNVSVECVRADLQQFLAQLQSRNLIEIDETGSA